MESITDKTSESLAPIDLPQQPRFEFRSFAQNFTEAVYRMSRLSVPVPESFWQQRSNEIYFISKQNSRHNVKIRGGLIDIKTLLQTKEELEQWYPSFKMPFPIALSALQDEIFPALAVDGNIPELVASSYSEAELLTLVSAIPDIHIVRVSKVRHAYNVNDTLCEFAKVLVNGAQISTLCIESINIADIKKTQREIGLEHVENINYVEAIKRIIGMVDKPFENSDLTVKNGIGD